MRILTLLAITASAAFAGVPFKAPQVTTSDAHVEPFVLAESGFSFKSDYEGGGRGSALEWRTQAGVLIPLPNAPLPGRSFGMWNLRLGMDWHRFEFDHSGLLPLPDRLQSVSAIVGLELHVNDRLGALLEVRPGVYFEDEAGSNAWNLPVRLGVGYRVNDRFSLGLMGRYDGFAKYQVIGGPGFIWKISDTVTLNAIAPEPRIVWQATEQVALWAGGEFTGGAYRTGLRGGAIVDYTEYRAYAGATWNAGSWKLEAAAGASLRREWDFHREDRRIRTDEAAPFIKVSAGTKW